MAKILGSTTTYHGTEHPYLKGYKVRIVAVLKNAARPDIDVDGPDYAHLSDEDDPARAGGVTADDRMGTFFLTRDGWPKKHYDGITYEPIPKKYQHRCDHAGFEAIR